MTRFQEMLRITLLSMLMTFSGQSVAVDRIFLLDTSGSMKRDGLFNRIRQTLEDRYVRQAEDGEHIIILSFDENVSIVADQKLQSKTDRGDVIERLGELQANGRWTWLSRALEMAMTQAERLQASNPDGELNMYLLTDGMNDPPPSVHEEPASLAEILSRNSKAWDELRTNIYIMVYDKESTALKDSGLQRWATESRDRLSEDPLPPEIRLSFTDFLPTENGDDVPVNHVYGSLHIENIGNGAIGTNISLIVDSESQMTEGDIRLRTESISVQYAGQTEDIDVEITGSPESGSHVGNILLAANGAMVVPQRIPIVIGDRMDDRMDSLSKSVPDTGETGNQIYTLPQREPPIEEFEPDKSVLLGWPAIPVLLVMLAILYLLFLLLRQKDLWVSRVGGDELFRVQISGIRKVSLRQLGAKNFALGLGVSPSDLLSLFLFREGRRVTRVHLDREVEIENTPSGTLTILVSEKNVGGKVPQGGQQGLRERVDRVDMDPDFVKKNKKKHSGI